MLKMKAVVCELERGVIPGYVGDEWIKLSLVVQVREGGVRRLEGKGYGARGSGSECNIWPIRGPSVPVGHF